MTPTEMRESRLQMEKEVQDRVCVVCNSQPRVAYAGMLNGDQGHVYRCNCYPKQPHMRKEQPNNIQEKLGGLVNKEMEEGTGEILPAPRITDAVVTRSELDEPMSLAKLQARMDAMKFVVRNMEEGVHFGKVKGNKSLWEPGAEMLRWAFNVRWDFEIVDQTEDFEASVFRYKVRAFALDAFGNIGASWTAQAASAEVGDAGPQLPNLTLDKAIKRAFVNLMKNITGASGIFKDAAVGDERDQSTIEEEASHPWLAYCPDHNRKWALQTSKKDGNQWYSHKTQEGAWCNQSAVLNPMILKVFGAELDRLGVTDRGVWLETHYAVESMKDLTMPKRLEVIEALKLETAPPTSPPETRTPADVPGATSDADDLYGPGAGSANGSSNEEQNQEPPKTEGESVGYSDSPPVFKSVTDLLGWAEETYSITLEDILLVTGAEARKDIPFTDASLRGQLRAYALSKQEDNSK